jgi:hypothetical protein
MTKRAGSRRDPVPAKALEMFKNMKQLGMNDFKTGKTIQDEFPERFADMLPRSVAIACRREVLNAATEGAVFDAIVNVPKAVDLPAILEDMTLPYRDCLLFSDVHLPYHDPDIIAEGMAFAKASKMKRVVLNGDTLDMHWASSYVNLSEEDADSSFKALGEFFLGLIENGMSDILLNFGNHEDRISRMTKGKLHLFSVIALAIDTLESRDRLRVRKAVRATNRPYIRFTDTPDGIDWVIGHPRRYRGKRLSLASDIALKWAKCHVATGHEHHIGWTVTDDGAYFAVNLPCTQDPERTEYLQMDMSPTARPVRGFGWLWDGAPGVWWQGAPNEWKSWMYHSARARGRAASKRAKGAA